MLKTSVDVLCDQCQKILYGRDGTADRHVTHIRLKGELAHSVWDEELKQYIYLELTRYVDKEAAFCTYECMSAWASSREFTALPKVKEAIKRKIAENEEASGTSTFMRR